MPSTNKNDNSFLGLKMPNIHLFLGWMSQQTGKAIPKYSSLHQRTQQEETAVRPPASHRSQQYVACDESHQSNRVALRLAFLKMSLKYSNGEQKKNSILIDTRQGDFHSR